MDAHDALAFVERHGVVLVAARGPVPRLTEAIAGEPIVGSWWGHRLGHEIYAVLGEVTESPDVLVCRVVGGKVTLVHRRLWPALIRCADRFDVALLARVDQVHTEHGRHENVEIPCPQWADPEVRDAAEKLDEDVAFAALGEWARSPTATRGRPGRSAGTNKQRSGR
jgi:hypothetical protein